DNVGSEGTDTLSGLEFVQFTDRTITLGAQSTWPLAQASAVLVPVNGAASWQLGATGGQGGLTYSLITAAAHGTAVVNANGTFSYTPAVGYQGSDSFVFRVTDGRGISSDATVSAASGAGGSFATLSETDRSPNALLSGGDLIASGTTSNQASRATIGMSSGKWYWEASYGGGTVGVQFGVGSAAMSLTSYQGSDVNGWGFWSTSGDAYHSGIGTHYGTGLSPTDTVMFALDMDAGKVWFGKNGVWFNGGNPLAGVNPAYSGLTGTIYPTGTHDSRTSPVFNFGQSAFAFAAPSGFNGVSTGPVVNATAGNDALLAAGGNDTLDGLAGNDLMSGGAGSDTYKFGRGSGNDTIDNNHSDAGIDRVLFGIGIVASDLAFSQSGNDMLVSIAGAADTLTIRNWFLGAQYQLASFVLADGTMVPPVMPITGTAGNDTLTGTAAADRLLGLAGNDTLDGAGGDDTVDGGDGNDTLVGGVGSDTYLFGLGAGQDTIDNTHSDAGVDRVLFGAGIIAADITYARSGNDLLVLLGGGVDQLT